MCVWKERGRVCFGHGKEGAVHFSRSLPDDKRKELGYRFMILIKQQTKTNSVA
jgi:hypothetical protein